ncbi:DUF1566 domain-containing protein [Rheinheimera muenzenbergensis]|uniref:DUF1566 domain-containing protein n=1 Tax=Rheinheimera muenzenbergensis TaxID=1193628 RepID=A0ABU8C6C2_9GAMM
MNAVSRIWVGLLLICVTPNALAAAVCTHINNENVNVPFSTPSSDFIVHNDGTVTHKPTGLMWMRCSIGQVWDGESCSGAESRLDWQNALAQTGTSYAGFTDWRLPNKNELASIVERRFCYPSINSAIFPNSPTGWFFDDARYWTSSPSPNVYSGAIDNRFVWVVGFGQGSITIWSKTDVGESGKVRLVRTAQ